MSNEEIYNEWTEFINDDRYKEYFMPNDEIWILKLNKVKEYIDNNNKSPSCSDKIIEIKQLGRWISHQQQNYKKKEKIMSNEEIYNEWTDFINNDKYKDFFKKKN
jgi:hypothetical protein